MAAICEDMGIAPLAIFAGDFNSTPQSAIYSFVQEGELDCVLEDRRMLSGQLESEERGWPPKRGSMPEPQPPDRKRVDCPYANMHQSAAPLPLRQ